MVVFPFIIQTIIFSHRLAWDQQTQFWKLVQEPVTWLLNCWRKRKRWHLCWYIVQGKEMTVQLEILHNNILISYSSPTCTLLELHIHVLYCSTCMSALWGRLQCYREVVHIPEYSRMLVSECLTTDPVVCGLSLLCTTLVNSQLICLLVSQQHV